MAAPISSASAANVLMSPPTQKALPAPVNTTLRMLSSSEQAMATSIISLALAKSMLLPCSGRLRVTVATCWCVSSCIKLMFFLCRFEWFCGGGMFLQAACVCVCGHLTIFKSPRIFTHTQLRCQAPYSLGCDCDGFCCCSNKSRKPMSKEKS